MKVYNEICIDIATGDVLYEDSYNYEGPVALCGGGGKGGGSKTTTTTVDQGPWKVQAPYLDYGFQQARSLYDQGGPNLQAAVQVPFTAAQNEGITGSISQAEAGSPLIPAVNNTYLGYVSPSLLNQNPAYPYLTNIASGQATNTNPSLGILSDLATGKYNANPANRYLTPFASGQEVYNNPAYRYLQPTASGQMLTPDTNPYLRASIDTALGLANSHLNSQFVQAGRTGSGLAADTAARALGDVATQAYSNAYNAERERQMQAAGLLGQTYNAEQAQRLAAAQQIGNQASEALRTQAMAGASLGSTYNQGAQTQAYAANALGNTYGDTQKLQLAALGMSPALHEFSYADLNKLLQMGTLQQQQAQAEAMAAMQNANLSQMQPYNNLDWYMRAVGGNYGQQGTTQQQVPTSGFNLGAGILGGMSSGAGLAAQLFPETAASSSVPGVAGAVLGGLLGAF